MEDPPKPKPTRAPGLPPLPPKAVNSTPASSPPTLDLSAIETAAKAQEAANAAPSESQVSSEPEPVPSCSGTDSDDDDADDDERCRSTSPVSTSKPQGSVSGTISFVQHVLVIQQIREFVKALVRLDHPELYSLADSVSTLARNKMRARAEQREEEGSEERFLSAGQVEALKVVLQALQDTCFYQHYASATASGTQAVTLLRASVFGSEASEASEVLASVDKARAFHYACLTLLKRAMSVHNCFEMLQLSHSISSADLKEASKLCCMANFSASILADPMGWAMLSDEDVLALLSNPCLQASSEWEVWESIVLWAMKDTGHRAAFIPTLLQYGVRLGELEVLQLQQLGTNPLVKCNPKASDLVASAYTQRMLSSVHKSHKATPNNQSHPGPVDQKLRGRGSGTPAWRQGSPGEERAPSIMIQNDHLQADTSKQGQMVPISDTQPQGQGEPHPNGAEGGAEAPQPAAEPVKQEQGIQGAQQQRIKQEQQPEGEQQQQQQQQQGEQQQEQQQQPLRYAFQKQGALHTQGAFHSHLMGGIATQPDLNSAISLNPEGLAPQKSGLQSAISLNPTGINPVSDDETGTAHPAKKSRLGN
eukprot:gene18564-25073_t